MSTSTIVSKPPPARGWYIAAGFLLVASIAGAGLFVVSRAAGLTNQLFQVVVPGRADLNLQATGTYTIFHEYRSVIDGKEYVSDASLSDLNVTIQSADGEQLKVALLTGTSRYAVSGRAGYSVFTFDVTRPGLYRLTASYRDGRAEPRTVIAVGSGFVGGILETVMIALAITFSGIGCAVVLLVVVYRARHRRRQDTPVA
jgi:hypothetical protein